MKQYLLTLLLAVQGFACLAATDSLTVYVPDAVDELLLQSYSGDLPLQSESVARANILKKVWEGITAPFKPVWGRYEEPGRRRQGPYTLFQHHKGDLPMQLQAIRNRILQKDPAYFKLYANIYKWAVSGPTGNCLGPKYPKNTCENANTAKCAAFVYIVGIEWLDVNGDDSANISVDSMSLIPYGSTRNAFAEKALLIVHFAHSPGLDNWVNDIADFGLLNVTTLPFWLNMGNGWSFRSLYYRSRELMSLLQAFDMVRWGHNVDPVLNNMSNYKQVNDAAAALTRSYIAPMFRKAASVSTWVNHNNHGIMLGAALGTAGVVLNDYGAYLLDLAERPNRWANIGNHSIHKIMWTDGFWNMITNGASGPMSQEGGLYGFSEGTHYFKATFQLLLPYMLAQYNYQAGDHTRTYHDYPAYLLNLLPGPWPMRMRTMYRDPDYDNMLKWYRNLLLPTGKVMSIDESWKDESLCGALAIKNQAEDGEYLCNIGSSDEEALGLNQDVYLSPDYLAAQPTLVNYTYGNVQMADGTTVIKQQVSGGGKTAAHFLLSSAEHGVAKNSWWHQQNVPGHLTVIADQNELLIDPARIAEGDVNNNGDDDYGELMRFKNHNIIYHGWNLEEDVYHRKNNVEGNYTATPFAIAPMNNRHEIEIITLDDDIRTNEGAIDSRIIKSYKGPGYFYYLVDDHATVFTDDAYNELRFNGNGKTGFTLSGSKARWDYSCVKAEATGKWSMLVETGATSSQVIYAHENNLHGYQNGDKLLETEPGKAWGLHSTFTARVENKDDVRFLSKITPYRCGEDSNTLTTVTNHDDYTLIYARIANGSDTIHNYHLGVNPQGMLTEQRGLIEVDKGTGFMSVSAQHEFRDKGCITFTHFRKGEIDGGSLLRYNDTNYISSDKQVNVYYELQGRFKYKGYVFAPLGATVVTIRMPDVEPNYAMVARNAETMALLGFNHNERVNHQYITINVPSGTTSFILELADPCLLSCFFPPTAHTIDTLFAFNTGTTETLGHNLDIIYDKGWLDINAGSKMSICPGYYLFNRDSITLASFEKMDQAYPVYSDYGDLPGGGSGTTNPEYNKRFGSRRSMIIVNNGAALILDSGSHTHVGVGSTVLIRRGGTLHVKSGATLEIGSNSMSDYGELIAEAGAYICIEDSSDLHFYATVKDTNNKNIFFIPVDAGVNERVNLEGINGNFALGGRFGAPKDCIPLCSLWQRLPVYGVNNPEFGNNSLGKPYAFFSNVPDTVCGTDTIVFLNALRSRNEVKYRITVTRDSLEGVSAGRSQAYPYQVLTAREPVNISVLGTGPGTLRFKLVVQNVCGDSDVYSKTMFIARNPSAMFVLSKDTICQGIGSLRVNGSASGSGTGDSIRHRWSVVLIDTTVYAPTDTNRIEYGGDWEYTARAVSDTFNFPGFKWLGGFRYAVGLTVFGRCSEAQHWDTVAVPLQVWVTANGLKTSPPLLGLMGVGLKGVIFSPYDSFTWQPKNKLSMPHTLTPVTLSTDTATRYVLSAYRKGCVARDTIRITYRKYVNLRNDTVLCRGNQLYVGNRFDAGILMGVLSTFGFTYSNKFLIREIGDPNFKKNFSLFLYYNDYQYYKMMFSCSESLMNYLITNSEQFYNARDYPTLYGYYFNNDLNMYFQYFSMFLQANPALKRQVDALRISINQTDLTRCINTIMAEYDYYNKNAVRTTWYRNGVFVPGLNNWLGIVERMAKPVEYQLMMVNGSTVEYDVVKLIPDSAIRPLFGIISQRDSTLQFANYTQGNALAYVWDFGDAQSSTAINPQHRFPVFNRTYKVCLSATNSCGSYRYCDSVKVDSSMLLFFGLGKKAGNSPDMPGMTHGSMNEQTPVALLGRNVLGANRPNPFDNSTLIDYELVPDYKEAWLHVTNLVGQTVHRIRIPVVKGTISFDRDKLDAGLYYYTLVVDGSTADTKMMMVK